jgi:hypothetical protein
MSFAEIFLRLGSALVAWMVLYSYYLWVAILRQAGCGADGDELYRLLLGMAPLTVGISILLRVTRPLADVHRALRWLSVPMLFLIPAAILSIWSVMARVTFGGEGICAPAAPSAWQTWWAPVQVVTVLISSWMLIRLWRREP